MSEMSEREREREIERDRETDRETETENGFTIVQGEHYTIYI